MRDLCDNIELVLASLLSGSTDVAASPSLYMTQPSGIPILCSVLFVHVGDPYIPPFRGVFDLPTLTLGEVIDIYNSDDTNM